jgi:hypothetical protein
MKKQKQNNRLAFNKAAVTELNDLQLYNLYGGSGTVCESSKKCLESLVDWLTLM